MTSSGWGSSGPRGAGSSSTSSTRGATGERLRICLTSTRVGGEEGKDHEVEALQQTARIDWLTQAAKRLALLEPDTVFWACTSGSFILGRDYAERQRDAIASAAGMPAGSTSLAFVKVLEEIGVRSVSVVATYPEPASRALASFLAEFGIEVIHLQWLDVPGGWDTSDMDPERIVNGVREAAVDGAGVVLVPDTALSDPLHRGASGKGSGPSRPHRERGIAVGSDGARGRTHSPARLRRAARRPPEIVVPFEVCARGRRCEARRGGD